MWTDEDYQQAQALLPTEQDPEKKRTLGSLIVKYESLNPQVKSPDLGGLPDRPAILDQPKSPESTSDFVSAARGAEAKPRIPSARSDEETASLGKDVRQANKLEAAPPTYYADKGTIGGAVGLANTRFFEEPSIEQFRADMRQGPLADTVDKYDESSREFRAYANKLWAKEYEDAKKEGRSVVRISEAPDALKLLGSAGNAVGAGGLALLDIVSLGASAGGRGRGPGHGFDEVREAGGLPPKEDEYHPFSRENQERIRGAHPVADVAGQVAGSAAPGGPVSLAMNKASRAAERVLPTANTGLRALRSGVIGGGVAGGESMVRDVMKGDEIDPERAAIIAALGVPAGMAGEFLGTASGKSAEKTLRSPGVRETVKPFEESGGAFGPALGAKLSPRAETTIDDAMRNQVDPVAQGVSDVRKPLASGALGLQESELAELGPRMTRYYEATKEARRPMNELGDALISELKRRTQVGGQDEAFVQRTGELKQHIKNVFKVYPASDIAQARQLAKSRPGSKIYSRQRLEDMGLGDLAPVPKPPVGAPPQQVPQEFPGTLSYLNGAGPQAEAATRVTSAGGATPSGPAPNRPLPPYPQAKPQVLESGLTNSSGEYFVLSARPKNPQEADVIIDAIDSRGKADGVGKPPDPMYERFMGQARAVRERFPANDVAPNTDEFVLDDGRRVTGFSALKARHDAARTGVRSRNERGGLPAQVPGAPGRRPGEPRVPDLSEAQWRTFEGNLRNFAQSGGTPESKAALTDFAEQKGVLDELRNLRQLGLERQAKQVAGGTDIYATAQGNVGTTGLVRGAVRRSLPLRAALAGDGNSIEEVANALSPSLRESLRKVRAGADPSTLPGYYQAPPSNLSFLGLRGGRTGPLANVEGTEEDADPELTKEDVENLIMLLEATR